MRYAVNLPIVGEYSDPKALVELARDAEAAGWDAVFVWDSLVFDPHRKPPVTDPWIVPGAIASHTEPNPRSERCSHPFSDSFSTYLGEQIPKMCHSTDVPGTPPKHHGR